MSRVELVPTTPEDLDFVDAAEREPSNARFITHWERDQHLAALHQADLMHRTAWQDGRRVGFVIIAGVASPHRSIEFRRIVVTDKGRGIGRQIVRQVKELAFGPLRAHRLWLDVKTENQNARRLYRSEGFVEEGTLRECLLEPSGFASLLVMSILAVENHSTDDDAKPQPRSDSR